MSTGIARMEHWTAGDYGGAFAGAVAALAAIGKGLAWLLNWQGAREQRRSKRLNEWEASLNRREREARNSIEVELKTIRQSVAAIGGALIEVTLELKVHNPSSSAVARAITIMRDWMPPEFFAADFSPQPELAKLVRDLDDQGGSDGSGNG